MSLYSVEQQQFGLKKEAVRGTAESAPSKWYATRGRAEIDYALKHLNDEGIRGRASRYAPIAGIKEGSAKLPLVLDAQTIGEFLYSCLGGVASAQQGGTAAYKHTFTPGSSIQKPAYTLFLDRGQSVLKYNLAVIKSLSLKGGVDNLIEVDAEAVFKSEASGSIGSPSYPTQRYLGFQNVQFNIAGAQSTDVKEWSLKIDNGARAHRVLVASQDASDVLSPEKLMVDGGFTVYFQNSTERDKFIANTAVALEIIATGGVAATIYNYAVDINIYEARYTAFPWGEDQGLLAAKVTFEAFYNSTAAKEIQVDVTNLDTAY